MVEKGSDSGVIFECKGVSSLDSMPLAKQPVLATLNISETSRTVGCSMLAENGNCQAVSPINQRASPYLLPKTVLNSSVEAVNLMEAPSKSSAKFRILAQKLEVEITTGTLSGKLGTLKKLSEEYGISFQTMRKVLRILRAKGLVVNTEDGICVNDKGSSRVSIGNFLDTELAKPKPKSYNPSTTKWIDLVQGVNPDVEIKVDGLRSRLTDIVRVDDLDRRHTCGRRRALQAEFNYGGEIDDLLDGDDLALQQACDTLIQDGSALGALIFSPFGGGLREDSEELANVLWSMRNHRATGERKGRQ
jgi:DNA-binding transcriptional regulator YhcF (GntR family)